MFVASLPFFTKLTMMNIKNVVCSVAALFIACAGIDAKIINRQPAGEIPFTLAGDSRIYVSATVNGSDTLNFLVDTGASSLVLNTNSPKLQGHIHNGDKADNLGASGQNTVEYSNDNTVTIGSIKYEQAGCAHIPYPADYWDGVVGLNALAAFNIEINYDDFKIYCYSKGEPMEGTESLVAFPFEYKYDVPFITVPAKINGSVYDLLLEVDTGSDRVLDLNTPFVNSHNLLDTQKPFAISRISSSDGGSGELKNVFFEEVRIGQYVLPKVAGAFSTLTEGMQSKSDIDGTLGNNFLKRFNMVIDFNGQTIWLQPNNYLYTPFYGFLVK